MLARLAREARWPRAFGNPRPASREARLGTGSEHYPRLGSCQENSADALLSANYCLTNFSGGAEGRSRTLMLSRYRQSRAKRVAARRDEGALRAMPLRPEQSRCGSSLGRN